MGLLDVRLVLNTAGVRVHEAFAFNRCAGVRSGYIGAGSLRLHFRVHQVQWRITGGLPTGKPVVEHGLPDTQYTVTVMVLAGSHWTYLGEHLFACIRSR